MPIPTSRDVHVDQLLTNISIAYMQKAENLIADKVFPIVPVRKQSDRILKFDKSYWMRVQAGKRAPGTESRGAGFALDSSTTYFADIHAVHWDLDEPTAKNSDIADLERQIVEFLTWQILMERELEFVNSYFDPTGKTEGVDFWEIWTSTDLHNGATWDNTEDSDPILDIESAKKEILKTTGILPNRLIIGPDVYAALRAHPKIQAQVVYSPSASDVKGLVTPELLAKLFDLEGVYVGKVSYCRNPEGATLNPEFMFGPHALLVYAPSQPGLLTPTGGYIFAWTGYNEGFSVAVGLIEAPLLKATRYEVEMAYDMKLLGPDLGIFFQGVVSV